MAVGLQREPRPLRISSLEGRLTLSVTIFGNGPWEVISVMRSRGGVLRGEEHPLRDICRACCGKGATNTTIAAPGRASRRAESGPASAGAGPWCALVEVAGGWGGACWELARGLYLGLVGPTSKAGPRARQAVGFLPGPGCGGPTAAGGGRSRPGAGQSSTEHGGLAIVCCTSSLWPGSRLSFCDEHRTHATC